MNPPPFPVPSCCRDHAQRAEALTLDWSRFREREQYYGEWEEFHRAMGAGGHWTLRQGRFELRSRATWTARRTATEAALLLLRIAAAGCGRDPGAPTQALLLGIEPSGALRVLLSPRAGPVAAVALLRRDDGRYLSVTRRGRPGTVSFPGGKLLPGETPRAGAARELKEETGVTALRLEPLHADRDEDGHLTQGFAVLAWRGEPATREPGVEVSWAPRAAFEDPARAPFPGWNARRLREREELE